MLQLTGPTLLLDKEKCRRNISVMAQKANRHNLIFRPHFKTHQSLVIGEWFRQSGVDKITVSSVSMAIYFANAGWKDITIAFPFNIWEMDKINRLASKITVNLLIASSETVDYLTHNLNEKVGIFIKIDTGYHRSGLQENDEAEIYKILELCLQCKNTDFKGLVTHSGNTYSAQSRDEILTIHDQTVEKINHLKKNLLRHKNDIIASIGDTPGCRLSENFEGIDEIRPGNFVFYDLMQLNLGVCSPEEIAVAMACPVVDKNISRNQLIIYGGGIHFSKEFLKDSRGTPYYGKIVTLKEDSWSQPIEGFMLTGLSQEHGIVSGPQQMIEKYGIGDFIGVLPVHSCLTAQCMKHYVLTTSGMADHF